MRLPFRSRGANERDGGGPTDRDELDRQAPPAVLTTWLRQGLRSGICPLCRVAHKADREYIWHFYDEGADQGEVVDGLASAFGFCAEHVEMLRSIDVDSMKSTLAISTMFVDLFAAIGETLDALSLHDAIDREPCPACANRNRYLRANARYLLDELAASPGYRADFERSAGVCFPHFELLWNVAPSRSDRERILSVQRAAARSVLNDLQEHVRMLDNRFRHEPKGGEADSWLRAILMTSGWPAPVQSAAEPEDR
jgi:hypothetical protein